MAVDPFAQDDEQDDEEWTTKTITKKKLTKHSKVRTKAVLDDDAIQSNRQ